MPNDKQPEDTMIAYLRFVCGIAFGARVFGIHRHWQFIGAVSIGMMPKGIAKCGRTGQSRERPIAIIRSGA
jgi:hypothetical protein